MKILAVFTVVILVLGFSVFASAEEFDTAVSVMSYNVPPGADVAGMGNAWVANPEFSSNNPAVLPTLLEKSKFMSCANGTLIDFKNGPDISVGSISSAFKLGDKLVFQFSYAGGGSKTHRESEFHRGENWYESWSWEQSLKFNKLQFFSAQLGTKLGEGLLFRNDKLFAGIGYSYSESKISIDVFQGTPATTFRNSLKARSSDDTYTGGILYSPTSYLNLGVYYSFSGGISETLINHWLKVERYNSQQLRIGASVQVAKMTKIAVDYQHLNIDGKKKSQIFAGVEQGIVKDFLYIYGGWAANGPTAGVGAYFKHGGVNIAYMHQPFKEAKSSLGKSRVIMAQVYVNF